MSKDLAVSMDELEREGAELLPSRETLCCWKCGPQHGGSTTNVTNVSQVFQSNSASANGDLIGIAIGGVNINDVSL